MFFFSTIFFSNKAFIILRYQNVWRDTIYVCVKNKPMHKYCIRSQEVFVIFFLCVKNKKNGQIFYHNMMWCGLLALRIRVKLAHRFDIFKQYLNSLLQNASVAYQMNSAKYKVRSVYLFDNPITKKGQGRCCSSYIFVHFIHFWET